MNQEFNLPLVDYALQGDFKLIFQDNYPFFHEPFQISPNGQRFIARIEHSGMRFTAELPNPHLPEDQLSNWANSIAYEEEVASVAYNLGLHVRPVYWAAPVALAFDVQTNPFSLNQREHHEVPFKMLVKTDDAQLGYPYFSATRKDGSNILESLGIPKLTEQNFRAIFTKELQNDIAKVVAYGFRNKEMLSIRRQLESKTPFVPKDTTRQESVSRGNFNIAVINGRLRVFLDNFDGMTLMPHFGYKLQVRELSRYFQEQRDQIVIEIAAYYDFVIHIICMNMNPSDYGENFAFMQRVLSGNGNTSTIVQTLDLFKTQTNRMLLGHENTDLERTIDSAEDN